MTRIYQARFVCCVLLSSLMLLARGAYADNPVSWNFFVETTGSDASWTSTTNLDTGFPEHAYTYEITQAEVQIDFLGGLTWVPILSEIPEDDRIGGGTFGLLPALIIDQTFAADDNSVTVELGVDGFGQGYADLTEVQLGSLPVFGDVSGIRLGGNINIVAVPEPTGLALLGVTTAALLMVRRPRPKRFADRRQ